MSTATKVFEDGVYYTDTSKFIDYPKVKLMSYEKREGEKFRRIIFFTCLFSFVSGLAFIFF